MAHEISRRCRRRRRLDAAADVVFRHIQYYLTASSSLHYTKLHALEGGINHSHLKTKAH